MKKQTFGFTDEFSPEYKITETENYTFYEFHIEETSPLEWLKHQVFKQKIYFQNREQTLEIAGGENLFTSPKDLDDLENFLIQSNHDYLYAFSALPFEKVWTEPWTHFECFANFVPRFQLIRDHQKTILLVVHHNDEDPQETLDQLSKTQNYTKTKTSVQSSSSLPSSKEWVKLFDKAQAELNKYAKLVLARKESLSLTTSADPYFLLQSSTYQNSNNQGYKWLLQSSPNNVFISLTPERLFYIKDSNLYTEAVAGTRPRSENILEDQNYESELLNSDKDLIEHKIVVQDIKHALEQLFDDVTYPAQPEILKQPTVQHLKTPIQGSNSNGATTEEILWSLHPTPAVCGSPQKESLQWLIKNQGFQRGLYASALGVLHRDFSEWSVGIRSAHLHDNTIDIYTGAGIVADSSATQEWEELNQKSKQLMELL